MPVLNRLLKAMAIPPNSPIILIPSLVNVKDENPNILRAYSMINGSSSTVRPEAILTPE
jgi:hypothetical protein